YQRAVESQAAAIHRVDGWGCKRHRDAGCQFQQVSAEQGCVVGAATGDKYDQIDVTTAEGRTEFGYFSLFACYGSSERLRLLTDFFKHQGHAADHSITASAEC